MEKKTSSSGTILRSRMTTNFEFSGCIMADGKLNFCKWDVSLTFGYRPLRKGETKEDLQKKLSVSFYKISTWLQYFMNDIFIVDVKDSKLIDGLFSLEVDNPIMMAPGTPSDGLLVQLIHAKASTLSQGDLIVEDANISEVNSKTSFFFNPDEMKYDLPTQKDFVGASALHVKPWWFRYDCDTIDLSVPKGVKKKDMLIDTDTSDFLRDLEKSMYDSFAGTGDREGEIIEFPTSRGPKWKPEEH